MKLLVREYLASLKERDELDAILPDLLSEQGFNVISRPGRGTSQNGVDIAAVGTDDDGVKKLFLFTVKRGDLTRKDWQGSSQALRPSLDDILDVYIPNRVPARYRTLPVVVCIAFGGDVHEAVRERLSSYTSQRCTEQISFVEWNGDKIAELVLSGILKEKFLPKEFRGFFQKAVAMVDEPDIAYKHFFRLVCAVHDQVQEAPRARLRAARQLNIAVWVLYVWARDVDNLEAPYRASEIALLVGWQLLRPIAGRRGKTADALRFAVFQMMLLHLRIAGEYLDKKVRPWTDIEHGLSFAVGTRESLDVNLALFDVLGRLAMAGLWVHWFSSLETQSGAIDRERLMPGGGASRYFASGVELIKNNPALLLPCSDSQTTDIALFLLLALAVGEGASVTGWLEEMSNRLDIAFRIGQHYPISSSNYIDLLRRRAGASGEEFEAAVSGSTLLPTLAAWLKALGRQDSVRILADLVGEKLGHCTLQLWMPDETTEERIYVPGVGHGRAIANLPLDSSGDRLVEAISCALRDGKNEAELSVYRFGWWPLLLTACRHHKWPVPPSLWFAALFPESEGGEPDEELPEGG